MRVRKERLKSDWWGGVKKDLPPGKYRQLAVKVYGKEEGKKKADIQQRQHYEKQSAGAKKKVVKPEAVKKETPIKVEKFKPATKKQVEELVKKSLKKKKKKKG